MPKGLKHILFSVMLLAALICLLSFSASAFTYEGSVYDVDLSTFTVDIGGTTLPLQKYPDGSVTPFSNLSPSYANYMTPAEAQEYGFSLSGNLWLRSAECMAFARYVYAALYYKYPATATMDNFIASEINPYGSYAYVDMISTPWSGGSYSASDFEALIKSCYPGSFIRQGGHSMVIMAIFDDGLIVYDANGMGNYNEVDVRRYTWQGYINSYGGRSIYALQIPSYYPGYTYSTGGTGGGAYDYDLDVSKAGLYKIANVSSYLNVRSGPGTSYSAVGKIYLDTEVDVIGTYNGWAAIEYNGAACWLSMDYLELIALNVVINDYTLDTSTAGPYQINSPGIGYLNVRGLPSSSSEWKGSLEHGAVIEILGTYEGWAAFSFEGTYCWVSMEYLEWYTGTVMVYFEANGGDCEVAAQEYEVGSPFGELPVPVKADRNFLGWYCDDIRYMSDSIVPTYDITLTAKWGYKGFIDVDENQWYAPAVEYVFTNSIMQGTAGDMFEPDSNLTRASAAQILYNLAGQPEVEGTQSFPDVSYGVWYYEAAEWCAANGLATGNENGYFMPDDNITRQDFVVLLWRFATNYMGDDTSARAELSWFPDAELVSGYAQEALQWAVYEGIITGRGDDGTLSPKGAADRAMVAQIMMKYSVLYG